MDFLEELDELADAAEASSFYDNEGGGGRAGCSGQELDRRKRSFKVAGDMSTALKLFHQHALPANEDRGDEDGADMLAVILEFFLELCDEGQAGALAFFCPQVCHVHLQMLPATGARQLARAEMVEDFLLTVSARHSVSLALGLSWGLAADLEESLGEGGNCMPKLGRRYVKRTNGFAVNYRPPKEGDGPWEWDGPRAYYVGEWAKKVWGSETILGER